MKFSRFRPTAAAFLLTIFIFGCSAEHVFYFPNKVLYADPDKMGVKAELLYYPSLNGAKLCALYIPTDHEPKGTVVYFHGNYANLSNHFPQALFLTRRGFDVLVFDYEGFGASEGRSTPKKTVQDGLASVRYARDQLRAKDKVVVFGQSLGAAVAAVVAAREPAVKAVVLEAGFTTYRAIAKDVMRRSWLTWPFAFFIPSIYIRHRYDPIDEIGKIAPRPVLIIHGTADRTVPPKMSQELFAKAGEPKRLWLVEGAGHIESQRVAGEKYQDAIADFFAEALKANR